MLAFVIASFFAGLAGALYAHYVGTVNPNRFDVEEMVYVLIWAIVGGTATFYGPILGVVVLTILNEVVLRALGVDQMRPMFYGAILILFILFLPNGLESLVAKVEGMDCRRKAKRAIAEQPAEVVPARSARRRYRRFRARSGASSRKAAAISLRVSLSIAGRSRRQRAKRVGRASAQDRRARRPNPRCAPSPPRRSPASVPANAPGRCSR